MKIFKLFYNLIIYKTMQSVNYILYTIVAACIGYLYNRWESKQLVDENVVTNEKIKEFIRTKHNNIDNTNT